MDIHKKVELQRAIGKPVEGALKGMQTYRYICFAVPTLALFWLGVDFGVGDIDTQDLVVKVVLFVLFFSIIRRIYLDFFKSD